jgi:addiction module antitoxin
MIEIEILYNKKVNKFFDKHNEVKEKFEKNLVSFYLKENKNIDIKQIKGYNKIFRMRIQDYRVLFTTRHNELIIIEVLEAGNRGEIYKKYK